jgi:capsular exopolysaccharide synthesis family protein
MGEIQEALRQANLTRAGAAATPRPAAPERDLSAALRPPAPPPPSEREPARQVHLSRERDGRWTARGLLVDGAGAAPEMMRHLALRLRRELKQRNARSVAIVSAQREEGKTTTSCNLALALASLEHRRAVALVDLDLRHPSVGPGLGVQCETGIDDVLLGRRELAAARVSVDEPLLDVYPSRQTQGNAHKILGLPSFASTLHALEKQYEIVVLDTPPVLLVPDASLILETAGCAVAVVRAGRSTRRAVETLCAHLPAGRLLGAVLNEGQPPLSTESYGYYGVPPDGIDDSD